jgi:hypothetical protein
VKRKIRLKLISQGVPGSVENNLQLSQRVTEVKRKGSNGDQSTEQHIEQRSLADPAAGLQVTTKTLNTVQPSSSGTRETTSIEARDGSGNFTVVSFEIAPKKEAQTAPKKDKDK